jgi:uncharacterized membrane-anchored protein YjiN (DUF445 family)
MSPDQRDHPLRLRSSTSWWAKFADNLRDDPELQARVGTWIQDAAAHPTVTNAIEAGLG